MEVGASVVTPASIVIAVLLIVTSTSLGYLVHSSVKIHSSVTEVIRFVAGSELNILVIESGSRRSPVVVEFNLTLLAGEIEVLTESEIYVKYAELTSGKEVTHLLNYGAVPGWEVVEIEVGNVTYSVDEHNYLLPGERALIRVKLPSAASDTSPIVVVFSTRRGATATYSIG